MNTAQLRKAFLDYFQANGHTVVPSSSLVPLNDQTLLFTNAGMVQFKETFLGLEPKAYVRAASVQRCVRAGGKHNDLENVGYTARHHTFFEMLGNFSFGDYFKREAILFAWNFLIQVFKLPAERLWVTVFEEDKEAEKIWLEEVKIDPTRFSRCGIEDNFWSMGDTGPCGPCTEIFYDHGSEIPGGPPGSADADGDRFIEIWNLVFMEYNRTAEGIMSRLPKPSVDTGMGLERIAAVMQGVHSNYDIDLFKNLIYAVAQLAQMTDLQHKSLRVIADHIRSCGFLIVDGVLPSNEGRGYVLRRIMRRAIRHGYRLGLTEPFFYRLVKPLAIEMGEAYPELVEKIALVERVIYQEECQFARTLEQGLKILAQDLQTVKNGVIPGDTVFRLYDTYGFPVDLTADIARERGFTIDHAGFEHAMTEQRKRAREASQFSNNDNNGCYAHQETEFVGYEHLESETCIVGLYQENAPVSSLKEGETGAIVLLRTPFYAEAGGQVGDQGIVRWAHGCFEVHQTRKIGRTYVHFGLVLSGNFHLDTSVIATVDSIKRQATARNHSATHLLHAALRQLLGAGVQQKGSLVEPERLRFDFASPEALSLEQIQQIETIVNQKIREDSPVHTKVLPLEVAIQQGAVALFGEKYDTTVRVLQMGGAFSQELCGGTHVSRTGEIGFFKILKESGIASGVRRLEAITGEKTLVWSHQIEATLNRIAVFLKSPPELVEEKLQQLMSKQRQLEKELQHLQSTFMLGNRGDDLSVAAKKIRGISVLATISPIADVKILRDMVDKLKNKLQPAVIVLGAIEASNKITLIAGTSTEYREHLSAHELINYVAEQVGGKGGGRTDMAQGGGTQPDRLSGALESVYQWIETRLNLVK